VFGLHHWAPIKLQGPRFMYLAAPLLVDGSVYSARSWETEALSAWQEEVLDFWAAFWRDGFSGPWEAGCS